MELTIFFKYLAKFGFTIKMIISKPFAFISCLPVLTMPVFTTPQKALMLLGGLFVVDFITGIWACWIKYKKDWPVDQITGRRERLIKSAKLRLSAVKFGTYAIMILGAYGIEWVFVPGEFEPHARLQKMTLTTFVIAFCCVIEFYSIFFENVKRMGFDIVQKVKNITSDGWKLYKNVKGETNETK